MIKKRISAAVIVKNDKVVQSFSYNKYLPVGSVDVVIQNLDRWAVDDIVILNIDRTLCKSGPNLKIIKSLSSIPISTPLVYGGGISTVTDAIDVINAGAERIILDSLFINNPNVIKNISAAIGSQAIIISIPVKVINGYLFNFNYVTKKFTKLDLKKIKKYEHLISEIMVIDVDAEGKMGSYNNDLVDFFSKVNIGIICYGGVGLSHLGSNLLKKNSVNAIAYGNVLNYEELSFQKVKKSLNRSKKILRRSIFRDKI